MYMNPINYLIIQAVGKTIEKYFSKKKKTIEN